MNTSLKLALLLTFLASGLSYAVQVGELELDISQRSKELGIEPDAMCSYRLTTAGPIVECVSEQKARTIDMVATLIGTRGPVTPLNVNFTNAIGSFALPSKPSTAAAFEPRRLGSAGNQVIFCAGKRCMIRS